MTIAELVDKFRPCNCDVHGHNRPPWLLFGLKQLFLYDEVNIFAYKLLIGVQCISPHICT